MTVTCVVVTHVVGAQVTIVADYASAEVGGSHFIFHGGDGCLPVGRLAAVIAPPGDGNPMGSR